MDDAEVDVRFRMLVAEFTSNLVLARGAAAEAETLKLGGSAVEPPGTVAEGPAVTPPVFVLRLVAVAVTPGAFFAGVATSHVSPLGPLFWPVWLLVVVPAAVLASVMLAGWLLRLPNHSA